MTSKLETFIKSRAAEAKILQILVFLAILGGTRLIYGLAKLALLEMDFLIP